MDRFSGLDSLMSTFGLDKATNFQAYANEILSKVESQGEDLDGFVWDMPQIDFTYSQLETEAQIEVMASYVDLESPALPAGKQVNLVKLTGSIPRQKYAIVRGENDYRKQLITLNEIRAVASYTNTNATQSIREFLAKALFENLSELTTSHKNSLNYQVGQMKSKGALTLDDKNNPRGIRNITFSAQIPATNFITKNWWQVESEVVSPIESAEPIKELRDFMRELRWKANGYENVRVEMSVKTAYKLFSHPAVLAAFGYATTPGLRYSAANDKNAMVVGGNLSFEAQVDLFQQLIEANEVRLNKTQCGVEKLNNETKLYERTLLPAFDEDVILVRPMGNIGVIKNVAPLRPDGTATSATIYGGRGLIEYLYNAETRTQTWRSELTALAVPTRPKDMYYFKLQNKVVLGS